MQTTRWTPTTTRLSAAALVTSVLLLAGCASSPVRPNEQLDQARKTVHSLERDPDAQQVAAPQLRDARNDLQRAKAAFAKHRSQAEVTYLAYLAGREAETGLAHTDEYRAHQGLANGNEERNRILLEARNQQIEQAREATQAAQQRMQAAQSQAQKEQQELASMKARQTVRGLQLTLASNLLFNTGSATLKSGATLQLNRLADFMRGREKTRIIVEGYTDDRGSAVYNQQLSQARAQAVAGALESAGVASNRIRPVGRGKNFPVASNATPAGRQQNRRVDVILSDMAGHFAQAAMQGPPPQ